MPLASWGWANDVGKMHSKMNPLFVDNSCIYCTKLCNKT